MAQSLLMMLEHSLDIHIAMSHDIFEKFHSKVFLNKLPLKNQLKPILSYNMKSWEIIFRLDSNEQIGTVANTNASGNQLSTGRLSAGHQECSLESQRKDWHQRWSMPTYPAYDANCYARLWRNGFLVDTDEYMVWKNKRTCQEIWFTSLGALAE